MTTTSVMFNSLKEGLNEARRKQFNDTVTILSTVVGEVESKTKGTGAEVSDSLVLEILQNTYRNTLTNFNIYVFRSDSDSRTKAGAAEYELRLLEKYIPEDKLPLSTQQLLEYIKDYMYTTTPAPDKKKIMQWLGQNYKGRYNGKEVASAIDKLLS